MKPEPVLDADRVVRRRASGVAVLEHGNDPAWPKRRAFLQALAARGVPIPATYLLFGDNARAATLNPSGPQASANPSLRSAIAGQIIRDFSDPYIELIRLLHEASEIEHALMVQYLYAAFSIKPAAHAWTLLVDRPPSADAKRRHAVRLSQHRLRALSQRRQPLEIPPLHGGRGEQDHAQAHGSVS